MDPLTITCIVVVCAITVILIGISIGIMWLVNWNIERN
jgi:hypothetical protein